MSTLLWIVLSLFLLSFVGLFFFVRNGESKEEIPGTLSTIIVHSATLALILTAMLVGFMLVPMGAMFIAKQFFDFNTHISSIVFIGGIVVIYALIFDHLLGRIIRRVLTYHSIHHLYFNLLRFFIFLGITSFVSIPTDVSIWIALILTILFIIIDVGDRLFSNKEQPHA